MCHVIFIESVKNVVHCDNFIAETDDCFWGAARHFFFKKVRVRQPCVVDEK